MLISFSVENFASIKDKQTLSFEADSSQHLDKAYVVHVGGLRLLKLALIYGANASGKTTILKALSFLRSMILAPKQQKTEELGLRPYLFDERTAKSPTRFWLEFLQNGIRYSYELEVSVKAVLSEALYFHHPNKAKVYSRSTDLINQFTSIEFGSKIRNERSFELALAANTLWNNSVLGGYLKTNIEQAQLKEATAWFRGYLQDIVSPKTYLWGRISQSIVSGEIKKEDVLLILKQADFNISDISVDKIKNVAIEMDQILRLYKAPEMLIDAVLKNPLRQIQIEHTVNERRYELPFEQESEGTQRYFEFAGLLCLLIGKPGAFPIDELESSLHPDLYVHFLLSFLVNAKESQLIATTHYRELFNDRDIFRNDAIWFTDKSETAATILYSLADFDSSIIRDTSNILNAYKSGRLKGTPNLADYYIHLKP